jgi:hypothetical protein
MYLARKALLTASLCLAAPLAMAQATGIPDGLTGAWWDAQRSGQGLVIEQVEYPEPGRLDQLKAYWYSYDENGAPVYLVGAGDYRNGRAEIELIRTSGGRHGLALDPSAVRRTSWGRVVIEGLSCERVRVSYTPASGPAGTMEMTRLATTLGGATSRTSCEIVQPALGTVSASSCSNLGTCSAVTLPIRTSSLAQTSIIGNRPADYEVRSYRITAVGGDVRVAHVGVVDSHPGTSASVQGISLGQTIRAGQTVTVSLRSAWTNNVTESLRYQIAFTYTGFEGSGTNLSLDESVQLRTN